MVKRNPLVLTSKVTATGAYDSKTIRIPKPICKLLNIDIGDTLNITIDNKKNIIIWKEE